jgi:hypothetical protein
MLSLAALLPSAVRNHIPARACGLSCKVRSAPLSAVQSQPEVGVNAMESHVPKRTAAYRSLAFNSRLLPLLDSPDSLLWMAPALQVKSDELAFGRVQSSVRPVDAVGVDCWP